VLTHFIYLL